MKLRTCVAPSGKFLYGVHEPSFSVDNLRETDAVLPLGQLTDGQTVWNRDNFPHGPVKETGADGVFEVANPFPFRGTTYILKKSADRLANDPSQIHLPKPWIHHFMSLFEISSLRSNCPTNI